MVDSDDKDKYVPPRAHTWTWRHFHLRHSDGGARSFCNHCAWDIPTHCVPEDHAGVKKFAHGQTTNMNLHLKSRHSIDQDFDTTLQRGEAQVPAEAFQQQWSASGQKRAAGILAMWIARDRLPPNIVGGEGFRWATREFLLGPDPCATPPHYFTAYRRAQKAT